jgi:hypothetical protein
LLLERLPPIEEFMKNFVVEVLGYLLPPFFGANDELLGIEIIDFFFLFLLFDKGSPTSYLGYNELGEKKTQSWSIYLET